MSNEALTVVAFVTVPTFVVFMYMTRSALQTLFAQVTKLTEGRDEADNLLVIHDDRLTTVEQRIDVLHDQMRRHGLHLIPRADACRCREWVACQINGEPVLHLIRAREHPDAQTTDFAGVMRRIVL